MKQLPFVTHKPRFFVEIRQQPGLKLPPSPRFSLSFSNFLGHFCLLRSPWGRALVQNTHTIIKPEATTAGRSVSTSSLAQELSCFPILDISLFFPITYIMYFNFQWQNSTSDMLLQRLLKQLPKCVWSNPPLPSSVCLSVSFSLDRYIRYRYRYWYTI